MKITKNTELNINFARQLLNFLGEDTSPIKDDWCWGDLYKHYGNDVRTKVEAFFSDHPHSLAAYYMINYCGSDRKWAEPIIEAANDSYAAYLIALECDSGREWAESIIKETNDSYYAYCMVNNCGSSRKWAEKQQNENY